MTYEHYKQSLIKQGRWPKSKEDAYNDGRDIAIWEAAKALGMKEQTLKTMMESVPLLEV
jgi:hypothetical protein